MWASAFERGLSNLRRFAHGAGHAQMLQKLSIHHDDGLCVERILPIVYEITDSDAVND
jgi:hypothetical protein